MTDDEARQQAKLELFKNSLNHYEMLTGAVVSLIQTVLRVSFLLNGGAIIAALSVYIVKGSAGTALPDWSLGAASLCWIVGLLSGAISAGSTTRAQREFQVVAGITYQQQAREWYGLEIGTEKSTEDAEKCGYCFRDISKYAWRVSIGAFVLGAFIAVIGLYLKSYVAT